MKDDDNVNGYGGECRLDVLYGICVDKYFVMWVFYEKVTPIIERTFPVF